MIDSLETRWRSIARQPEQLDKKRAAEDELILLTAVRSTIAKTMAAILS